MKNVLAHLRITDFKTKVDSVTRSPTHPHGSPAHGNAFNRGQSLLPQNDWHSTICFLIGIEMILEHIKKA
jgi:hypothetical protein